MIIEFMYLFWGQKINILFLLYTENKQKSSSAFFYSKLILLSFLFQKVVITEFDEENFRIKAEG